MKIKTSSFAAALAVLLAFCLVFMVPVGAIGITDYDSLKLAIDAAASNGGTVTLTQDVTITSGDSSTAGKAIEITESVTLDLGGYTLTSEVYSNRTFWIVGDDVTFEIIGNNGKLNTSTNSDGKIYGFIDIRNGVTGVNVILNGGTYEGNTDAGAFIKIRDGSSSEIQINGITVTTNNAVINNNDGGALVLKVDGGTFTTTHSPDGDPNTPDPGPFSFCQAVGKSTGNYFKGVTIYTTNSDRPCIEVGSGMEVLLEDCRFTVTPTADPTGEAPAAAVAVSGGGKATLTGTTYTIVGATDDSQAAIIVYPSGGTIEINDGTTINADGFIALKAWADQNGNCVADSVITVYGGTITGGIDLIDEDGSGHDGDYKPLIEIEGGEINSNQFTITDKDDNDKAQLIVSGGSFTGNNPIDYLEDGYYSYSNNGKYVVTDEVPGLPTATIRTNVNETLTFSAEFTDAGTEQQAAYYKDWLVDFVLTINKDVSVENESYISGQNPIVTGWTEHDLVYTTGDELSIMTKVLGEVLARTVNYSVVKSLNEYSCGVFFPDEFLRNNTDLEVKIALVMKDVSSPESAQEIVNQTFKSPYHILTIKYDDGGVTPDKTDVLKEGDSITLTNPTRTGYDFAGWDGLQNTMPDSDLTVTAKWTAKSGSNTNSGTTSSGSSSSTTKPTEPETPVEPETPAEPEVGETTVETEVTDGGEVELETQVEAPVEGDGEGEAPAADKEEAKITAVVLPQGTNSEVTFIPISEHPAPAGKETSTKKVFEINVPTYEKGKPATIKFTMTVAELEADGKTASEVALWHFDEETGEWTKLLTSYTIVDGIVYFEAITYDFSPFAIIYEETPVEEPVDEPETPATPAPILAVLAGLGAAVVLRRK